MRVGFTLDGRSVDAHGDDWRPLLDVLREDFDLVAAKPGCGVGRCGACVVLVDGAPVNACLVPLARLDGSTVATVEGLDPNRVDAILAILREHHVAQCGYCMNGLVVSLAHAVGAEAVGADGLREAALAHICRCGGLIGLERAIPALVALGNAEGGP